MTAPRQTPRVVALAGGVGGARLADGLSRVLPAEALTIIVNTADDFEHWGLQICPDVDTVMYTLSGRAPQTRGWGIEGDTFHTLDKVRALGGEDWFQLGDQDLATHLHRTSLLKKGHTLTEVTKRLCAAHQIGPRVLPMTDGTVATRIHTDDAVLDFQRWLVEHRAAPTVRAISFEGDAHPSEEVKRALRDAELIVLCPSNPFVSIDPILSMAGVREHLVETPTVAVSPLIGGKAVKGPLEAMIRSLAAREPSAQAVAEHYGELLNAFVVSPGDAFTTSMPIMETNILIPTHEDRVRLASAVLEFADVAATL